MKTAKLTGLSPGPGDLAGALSFHGIDTLAVGVLSAFPGTDRLGTSIGRDVEFHVLDHDVRVDIDRTADFWSPSRIA